MGTPDTAHAVERAKLADLTPDPDNARLHPKGNRQMIERSLRELGAARSIVIDEQGVVLAGNGVVEAAATVGLDDVIIVDADGDAVIAVRRTGLTDDQKRRLALFDNRAAEMATWDKAVLARLKVAEPAALDGIFTTRVLNQIVTGDTPPAQAYQQRFELVVECANEPDLQALFDRLTKEGLRCRTLIL